MCIRDSLKHWLERELGASCAKAVLPVMQEHYRLAHIRKPEFMGNTREEEKEDVYKRQMSDFRFALGA